MKKNEKFELPIDIDDAACVTECWIFNRLAIIKTSPYYEDWIASHYNLFYNERYKFYFGQMDILEPSYHDTILERKPVRIFSLNKENIIKEMLSFVTRGYYLNFTVKVDKENDIYHEVLIYGFDNENEEFLIIELKNRKFQKSTIKYEFIKETLINVKKHFLDKKTLSIHLATNFQYPITAMKLNDNYSDINCAVEAYLKLKKELDGKKYIKQSALGYNLYNNNKSVHSGISCLNALQEILNKYANQNNGVSFGVSFDLKKLHEHTKLVLFSMNYLYSKWDSIMTDESIDFINQYSVALKYIEKWFNLAMHYEYTYNKEDLKKILKEIPIVYKIEKSALDGFLNKTIDWKKYNKEFT